MRPSALWGPQTGPWCMDPFGPDGIHMQCQCAMVAIAMPTNGDFHHDFHHSNHWDFMNLPFPCPRISRRGQPIHSDGNAADVHPRGRIGRGCSRAGHLRGGPGGQPGPVESGFGCGSRHQRTPIRYRTHDTCVI